MPKFLFFLLVLLNFLFLDFAGTLGESAIVPVKAQEQSAVLPKKVLIPKINLEAIIEPVGLEGSGRMSMPENTSRVAWYSLGPQPGEVGSAVLAGHFNLSGGPSVFYRLKELGLGDEVIVEDRNGEDQRFVIVDRKVYNEISFPVADVFSKKDKKRLNLITCTGEFDSQKDDYLQRLVLYAIKDS